MTKCSQCGKEMKKCMCKTHKSSSSAPTEAGLLKALDDLEKASIPKEMKDADGGFATEGNGNELQVSAEENAEPKGGKAKKSVAAEESSEIEKAEEESSEESSADEESSEESSDEESSPPMKMSKKAGKSVKKGKGEETSGEEHSPAETSSPELSSEESSIGESPKSVKKMAYSKKPGKSIKKSLVEDEGNRELVEASSFLESLVDATSDAVAGLQKSLEDTMGEQKLFNSRLAKAVIEIGNLATTQAKELRRLRKALAETPVVSQGKTKLTKSEVEERTFTQQQGAEEELDVEGFRKSLDALTTLAVQGKIRPEVVTDFELTKSLATLPAEVRNMIAGGLH